MKKVFAIFVFFTLLIQSFAHYSVLAMFELRRDFIAKNLCENRNRPKMKCGGKCYLRKQLKKVDNSPDTSTTQTKDKDPLKLLIFIVPQPLSLHHYVVQVMAVLNPVSQHLFDVSGLYSILRPPEHCCRFISVYYYI